MREKPRRHLLAVLQMHKDSCARPEVEPGLTHMEKWSVRASSSRGHMGGGPGGHRRRRVGVQSRICGCGTHTRHRGGLQGLRRVRAAPSLCKFALQETAERKGTGAEGAEIGQRFT